MLRIDDLIIGFDRGLRTVFAQARSVRPTPGEALPEAELDAAPRAQAAARMRVNPSGQIGPQALSQGPAIAAHTRPRASSPRDARPGTASGSPRRRSADARLGRPASVSRRAIVARPAPAPVARRQRLTDCLYPWRLSRKSAGLYTAPM